jgi:hypothetical protein
MRVHEILNGSGALSSTSVMEATNQSLDKSIKAALIPLKAQKVEKITVAQFMDTLKHNPEITGIDFDQSFIVDRLGQSKVVNKIQADPENDGLMTIYFDFPMGDRQIDAKTKDREEQGIKKAALRAIKDKQK